MSDTPLSDAVIAIAQRMIGNWEGPIEQLYGFLRLIVKAEREGREREVAELREALEKCSSKLRSLGREFSRTNFTDRYGDGPDCLALAKHAQEVLDALKGKP